MSSLPILKKRDDSAVEVVNLDELTKRCMGDLAFVGKTLDRFQETLGGDYEEVLQAASAGDVDLVASVAHRMKGAAATVAATALREVAAEMEAAAHNDDFHRIWSLMSQLASEKERLERSIPRFVLPAPQRSDGMTRESRTVV